MKPAPFDYLAPRSLDEALGLLAKHGDAAKVIAGGQSLGPLLNMRLARPEVLIDLNRVPELNFLHHEDGGLTIGAMVRQRQLERSPDAAGGWPLLREAASFIGHTAIRNRGTFGGSLAHADPAAEFSPVVVALDGQLILRSRRGQRTVRPAEFFVSYLTTCLAPDELLVEVRLPARPPRTGYAWQEFARRHGDFALVGVAAVVSLDTHGVCGAARLVFAGLGPVPFDARAASGLIGQRLEAEVFTQAAEAAAAECDPNADLHASAEYRRHLVRSLTRQALTRAFAEASRA
jgi:aerobic carbon-monoxide dehydrogenase medium subunit